MAHVLRVLDAARAVVDEVNRLCDGSRRRLLYDKQLRSAAQSICADIREAFGRRRGAERNQFLRFARGSAEEVDKHRRSNWGARRVEATEYWPLHNRLVAIIKILTSLMTGEADDGSKAGSDDGSKGEPRAAKRRGRSGRRR